MTTRSYYYAYNKRAPWFVPGGGSYDATQDNRPVIPRRGPTKWRILTMTEVGHNCSSCSQRILPGSDYYVTPKGSLRHAQCSLQG